LSLVEGVMDNFSKTVLARFDSTYSLAEPSRPKE